MLLYVKLTMIILKKMLTYPQSCDIR